MKIKQPIQLQNLQEPHDCVVEGNDYVSKINDKWYFVTKDRKAYGIAFCPWCGENLCEKEVEK